MSVLPNIQELIDANRIEEAIAAMDEYLQEKAEDDEGYFERGKLWWRLQRYSSAVTDFERAVAINPESGARHALELARDVFDYYNPDLLNP